MKKLRTALCYLMLIVPVAALGQGKPPESKKRPMTNAELAEKKQAVHKKATDCGAQAKKKQLKQGSKEFVEFMTQCVRK